MTNDKLPEEMQEQIKQQAEDFANSHVNGRAQPDIWETVFRANEAGATAYATRLHKLQVEFNNIRKANQRWEESFNMAQRGYDAAYNDLQKLNTEHQELRERSDRIKTILQEFVSKHEAGLLPDRFVYEKAINILNDGK